MADELRAVREELQVFETKRPMAKMLLRELGNMREATAAAHRSAEVRLQQLAGQQLKALEEFDARLGRARDARDRAKEAQRKAEGETAVWRVCATTALAEVRRGEDEPAHHRARRHRVKVARGSKTPRATRGDAE